MRPHNFFYTGLANLITFLLGILDTKEELFLPLNNTWKTVQPENKIFGGTDEESVITFQCLQKEGSSKIFMSKTMESPIGLYEVRYSFVTDVNRMYSRKSLKHYLWEDVVHFMQLVQLCDNDTKDCACPLS